MVVKNYGKNSIALATKFFLSYMGSSIIVSIFYVIWMAFNFSSNFQGTDISPWGFSVFFYFTSGFFVSLFVAFIPWWLIIQVSSLFYHFRFIVFALFGAILSFMVNCLFAVSPYDFGETHSELEFAVAKSEGVCFLAAGLLFGISFWFFSKRIMGERGATHHF
jgi:hypothetical protein